MHSIFNIELERCLSGRKDMFAKHANGKLFRGFESLLLRDKCKKRPCGAFLFSRTSESLLSKICRKIKKYPV